LKSSAGKSGSSITVDTASVVSSGPAVNSCRKYGLPTRKKIGKQVIKKKNNIPVKGKFLKHNTKINICIHFMQDHGILHFFRVRMNFLIRPLSSAAILNRMILGTGIRSLNIVLDETKHQVSTHHHFSQ
jgi:hypothetical protein